MKKIYLPLFAAFICSFWHQCKGQCYYPQGPCDDGYMDATNGNSYQWACGSGCIGGPYRTDFYCTCACVGCSLFPVEITHSPTHAPTPSTPSPTLSPTPSPTHSPTHSPTPSPTTVPTISPTPSPTACPLVNGEFCGYTLFVKGYNIFTTKTSGNAITDIDYIAENTESWTNEGSTCSLSSLEFTTSFTSYSQYASYDTQSIGASFSTSKYGAGGSLSTTRTQTKHYSSLSQTYIYVLDLKCVSAVASVVSYNEIIWNSNFVNNLRTLPTSFTDTIISTNNLDLLEPWIDFWNAFGTHLISTAELGGNIRGTITSDKCNVEHMFSDSRAYKVCLNGVYKGISVEGCYEEGYSSSSGDSFEKSISNTLITVKGGDNSEFTNVFNQFGSKENDFQFWITQLQEFPDIIGGNLDEIHDVIQQTIKLGNHKLNNYLSTENYVDDNTWIAIADAMESAYNAYSQYLNDNDPIFGDITCSLNCQEGEVETLSCSCNQCSNDLGCCPERADDVYQIDIVVNILVTTFILYYVKLQ